MLFISGTQEKVSGWEAWNGFYVNIIDLKRRRAVINK